MYLIISAIVHLIRAILNTIEAEKERQKYNNR